MVVQGGGAGSHARGTPVQEMIAGNTSKGLEETWLENLLEADYWYPHHQIALFHCLDVCYNQPDLGERQYKPWTCKGRFDPAGNTSKGLEETWLESLLEAEYWYPRADAERKGNTLDRPGVHPGASRWLLQTTLIQMQPPEGSICGRLT